MATNPKGREQVEAGTHATYGRGKLHRRYNYGANRCADPETIEEEKSAPEKCEKWWSSQGKV